MEDYACTNAEFRSVNSLVGNGGRFVYFSGGVWRNIDYIGVKVDLENIYFGVVFPLSFTVTPLKIPKINCISEGERMFYLRNRKVFSIPCSDSVERKVALLKFV